MQRRASTDSTHKTERYKGANTKLSQSPCACTNKIKDRWDIEYNPRSTQFMGKNVCAMNSILACLDMRIRGGDS
jgi:hypothetical protein